MKRKKPTSKSYSSLTESMVKLDPDEIAEIERLLKKAEGEYEWWQQQDQDEDWIAEQQDLMDDKYD